MSPVKTFGAVIAVALSLAAISDSAWARRGGGGHGGGHHRGHHHHGHYHYGFGYWGGYWNPYWRAAYWPGYWGGYWGSGWGYWGGPVVAYSQVQYEPHVWVERDLATATPPPAAPTNPNPNAQQWWYWCVSASKYYPYVSSCAEGWKRVAPQAMPAQ